MAESRHPPPEPLAIYAPPSYPRESDPLHPHREKGAKAASHSVTSLPRSTGSSGDLKNSTSAEWLPYTLRLSLVWIPTALSLILALVVGLLYWRSRNNNGLSAESSAITGWRFAPTLMTVLWGQLITMLFNDIQRTEPFARLARPPGSVPPASRTILEGPRLVWTAFAHAWNKKHNGGKRSWIIIWASVVLVMSSIVISLSSALLASEEVTLRRPSEMKRLIPKKDSAIQPFVERDTFFRTTGAILQNVTTSPWISDDYSILPFWPSESSVSPWDAQYQSSAQTWEAETMVFHNDMQCSPLKLAGTDVWSYERTQYNSTEYRLSIRLENQEGCSYNLSFNASDASSYNWWDAGSWSDMDSYISGGAYAKTSMDAFNKASTFKPTYNDLCLGDEIIIMSSQWLRNDYYGLSNKTAKILSNLTATSYLCQSSHTMARLPVRVSTSANRFDVNFDVEEFRRVQEEVPASVLNTSGFVKFYTDPEWYTMIPKLGLASPEYFSGALLPVATQYEFNRTRMLNDPDLPKKAARFQRRHFGELLRTSLDASGASQDEGLTGSTLVIERRITVRLEAAAALVALLAFCFVALLGIIWLASVRRRPLHLTHEPATVLGTVSLVSSNPSVLAVLRDLDQASTGELRAALKGRYFSTSHGHLKEISGEGELMETEPKARIPTLAGKETPAWIKIRFLLGLLFYIALLIMAILVVHRFANESDLKKGFFTYHVNINALGRLGSFTPFSIVPTTLAVLFGLWWNALDVTFRVLQPYVSMSQGPKEIHRGAYVSYQSSYWLWATGKAAKNRHWLLSLVTFGTFCAQAFVIATSALFEQGTGVVFDSVQVNRTLELRQTPHIRMMSEFYPPRFNDGDGRGVYGYKYVEDTLEELFGNLTNNWMYSAVIEATLNGSEPNWSADGWSFVPLNLSGLDAHQSSSDDKTLEVYGSLVNVTLTTPALRGRVECHQPEEIRNGSTSWNTNSTLTDYKTNKTSPQNIPNSAMLGTTLAPDGMNIKCCTNNTNPSRGRTEMAPLAIGYWTQDFANASQYITGTLNNFTVKWIHGDGANVPTDMPESELYFSKIPKIQAVKCMPIFESSEAEIVVDKEDGKVLSYRILKEPTVDDSAWTDNFVFHKPTDPNDPVLQQELKSYTADCERKNLSDCSRPSARQNLTTSYGNLFMNSLLKASRLKALSNPDMHSYRGNEDLEDNVFNIRNNVTGLSLDFMSYSAYMKAGRNPEAFLDKDFMIKSTKEMFTMFFQHYVSSTVSLQTGGWAYQPIGANLDALGPVVNGSFPQFNADGTKAKTLSELPAQNTERTGTATMSTRVEVLRMNQKAVYLCVGLLAWLALTTIIVTALQRWFFGELRRNVETIADVLVLVAGSERLLAAVEKYGTEGLMNSNVKTRLGWFRTDDGRMRWGIEIVEDGEILMN